MPVDDIILVAMWFLFNTAVDGKNAGLALVLVH